MAGKAEGRRSWREALPRQGRNQRWKPEGEGALGRQSLALGYGAVKTAMHRRGGRRRGLERAATGLGVNMGQRLHAPVQQEKRGQTEPEAAQCDLHHDLKFNTCPRLSSPNGAVWRPWRTGGLAGRKRSGTAGTPSEASQPSSSRIGFSHFDLSLNVILRLETIDNNFPSR